jgi:hypothetical protein
LIVVGVVVVVVALYAIVLVCGCAVCAVGCPGDGALSHDRAHDGLTSASTFAIALVVVGVVVGVVAFCAIFFVGGRTVCAVGRPTEGALFRGGTRDGVATTAALAIALVVGGPVAVIVAFCAIFFVGGRAVCAVGGPVEGALLEDRAGDCVTDTVARSIALVVVGGVVFVVALFCVWRR